MDELPAVSRGGKGLVATLRDDLANVVVRTPRSAFFSVGVGALLYPLSEVEPGLGWLIALPLVGLVTLVGFGAALASLSQPESHGVARFGLVMVLMPLASLLITAFFPDEGGHVVLFSVVLGAWSIARGVVALVRSRSRSWPLATTTTILALAAPILLPPWSGLISMTRYDEIRSSSVGLYAYVLFSSVALAFVWMMPVVAKSLGTLVAPHSSVRLFGAAEVAVAPVLGVAALLQGRGSPTNELAYHGRHEYLQWFVLYPEILALLSLVIAVHGLLMLRATAEDRR